MRLTDKAERKPPGHCAVTGREDGPFIDFQVGLDLPRNEPYQLYLHKLIVEEAAELCGMMRAKEVQEVIEELKELRGELAQLNEALGALDVLRKVFKEQEPGGTDANDVHDQPEAVD